jgi:hypothetical protein
VEQDLLSSYSIGHLLQGISTLNFDLQLLARCLVSAVRLRGGLMAALAILLFASDSFGQREKSEEITFFTTDHVELAGTFYEGTRGKSSPCVLLLHNIGADAKEAGWTKLALHLQKKDYAVLSFDFRGHGQSTSVGPEFWSVPLHKLLKSLPNLSPNTIRAEQFTRPVHLATLINDIRAAKRVFDMKGRDGQCDSTNVFIVGAETGASLGILWLDAEWHRWRMAKDSGGRPAKQGQEALDIAGAVWLSINVKWGGKHPVPMENWLGSPLRERTPMGFIYGADDAKGKERSLAAFEKLNISGKEPLNKLSTTFGVSKSSLSGHQLLADDRLKVAESTANYFGTILETRRRIIRPGPDLDALPPIFNADGYGLR